MTDETKPVVAPVQEPPPIPLPQLDTAVSERVAMLLQIVNSTAGLPKMKSILASAGAELEAIEGKARVVWDKWAKDNASRDAEIQRRKDAYAAAQKAKAEASASPPPTSGPATGGTP